MSPRELVRTFDAVRAEPPQRWRVSRIRGLAALPAFVLLSGCTLTPKETAHEKKALDLVGERYEPPFEQRSIPDLPEHPQWQDVLRRAFLANGELEASYFGWKAALQRVDIAGAWPNTDVELGYEYMFSRERMNTFDRMTFSAGFDPSVNLVLPMKTRQAAKAALAEARAAGEKFRVAKFDLQRKVLNAWTDYTLLGQSIRLAEEDLSLRRMLAETAAARVGSGQMQRDLLESMLVLQMAESEQRDRQAERGQLRAVLNGLMGRDPKAALESPIEHPPPRPVPGDDAALIEAAAGVFPEVMEFAREVEARQEALELARLRWIPDFNLSAAFTGSAAQAIGMAIVLPTTIVQIRGQIAEAQSALRASEALLRQSTFDRVGEYVSLLIMLRNAQRREQFFRQSVLPLTEQLTNHQRRAYEAGAAELADVIDSQRMSLQARLTIAQAEAVIDKAIVEIECCLGTDVETLGSDSPATEPTPQSPPLAASNGLAPARNHEHE